MITGAGKSITESSSIKENQTGEFDNFLHDRTGHQVDIRTLEPFIYIADLPGKDIRGKMVDCFNVWLRLSDARVQDVKEIVGSLHNASLLVDDIEDGSQLRRGVPVANSIFGTPLVINCANYVYFLALAKVNELGIPAATSVFVHEMLNLHRGQGRDIYWRDSGICPSESEYREMVTDKTGGLFRLAIGLMQAFVEGPDNPFSSRDFSTLLNKLGLYFQIRDDLMNLCSAQYTEHKSFCEDLTEGKFSYPVIHAIHSFPSDRRILNILRQRTNDIEVKKYAVRLMKEFGSLKYTRDVLRDLRIEILLEINDRLGGHEQLVAVVNQLESDIDSEETSWCI